jgi:TetR/AcrR family transcriptional regulator
LGRPSTQHEARKAAIVIAALECFARYGYEGASNRVIAQAAGLKSAALIYHYFPNKESLFMACMESITAIDRVQQTLEGSHDDPPEVYLGRVAMIYLGTLREENIAKLIPMVFSASQSHPELLPIVFSRVQKAIILPMMRYLQHQMDVGRLRVVAPFVAAQQFFGPVVLRAMLRILAPGLPLQMPPDEEFVASLVSTYLDGMRVR